MTARRITVSIVALAALCGCADKPVQRNTVTGIVTLSGRIVEDGIVTLHGPDGRTATGGILGGGRYIIDDPPLGLCQITVTGSPGFASPVANSNSDPHAAPVEKASPFPKKYATPGNGLSVEVKPGGVTYDIVLIP